jgi:hypothetical protein
MQFLEKHSLRFVKPNDLVSKSVPDLIVSKQVVFYVETARNKTSFRISLSMSTKAIVF